MLVTMATNEKENNPGFRAAVSQVRRGSQGKCGSLKSLCLKMYRKCVISSDKAFILKEQHVEVS